MDLGLRGKRAAVMAASEGLGRGCAEALAREGAKVAICARRREQVEATAKALAEAHDTEVVPFVADVARAEEVRAFVDGAAEVLGGLDILVTNKGGPPLGRFEDLSDDDWQAGFERVVLSYIRAVRAALPHFRAAGGGAVVAIESTSVKQPIPLLVPSNVLRPSVVALSKSLASAHGHEGMRFNVVLPGSMDTERIRDLTRAEAREDGLSMEEGMKARLGVIPLGRLGAPIELGQVVAFLASPSGGYVTGTVLQVDGGLVRSVA